MVAEDLYGVPPEQVIGSSVKTKYEVRDGKPVIVRLPEIDFIDDQAGKPVKRRRTIISMKNDWRTVYPADQR